MALYRPWELLLLLKWVFVHGEFRNALTQPLRNNEFAWFVNQTGEVFNCARLPSEYERHHLFFRNVAYQQFWLQTEIQGGGIARQSLLFGTLPQNHTYRRQFREKFGLEIAEFIELSMMSLPKLQQPEAPVFSVGWFAPVATQYPAGTVERFLTALSMDVDGLRTSLSEQTAKAGRNFDWQMYERTPFRSVPLLRDGSRYVTISRTVMYRAIESFVYRFLRTTDPHAFMKHYGPLFERYVMRVLHYSGVLYWPEEALAKSCTGQKVVDALIRDGDCNILMDAKGVEFPEISMITHLPQLVRDRAKPSILKAIEQAYSTATTLSASGKATGPQFGSGRTYLIVVTTEETYLGNGADFFEMVGQDRFSDIRDRYGGSDIIPPERMYFISVQDFEILCQLIKRKETSFAIALEKASTDNLSMQTKKFLFQQHLLESHGEPDFLDFLREEIDRVFGRCEQRFEPRS